MRTADWTRVRPLLEEALELDGPARDERLLAAAGDDPELLAELRALAAEEPEEDFLVPPRAGAAQLATMELQSGWYVGQHLGAWRLEELIAVGGMGAVFTAARIESDFEQRAAVKVLATSLADGEAVRRFHRERQVLARLEHPGITRLLDGGTTEDGRPYLVMEWVDGRPIDHDAGSGDLPVEEALRRVREVCEAVAYAHRSLVVHRDIKPGNLLLTHDGRVKLLDFGISALLHEPSAEAAATTLSSAMTLRYSSPEQLRGRPITTATDVYSIGVVLYELLTGRTPLDDEPDLARAIERTCAGDFPPPGARRPGLDAELDAIVTTALDEDPARRYPSVEALSEDLGRYLDGEVVRAHPPTLSYRLAKLARRHKGPLLAAATVLALLVALALVLALSNARLARERAAAVEAREVAERVNGVLVAMLEGADPVRLEGGELTVLDLLEEAAAELDRMPDAPAAEAALRLTIGRAYLDLSLAADAAPHLQRAAALLRELPAERAARTRALEGLAAVAEWRLDLDAARAAMRECAATVEPALDGPAVQARVDSRLAELGAGSAPVEVTDALVESSLSHARAAADDEPRAAAATLERLAVLRVGEGRTQEGLALSEEALALRRARFSARPELLAEGLQARANVLLGAGETAGCEAALREAVELIEGTGGSPQLTSIDARIALGFCAMSTGDLEQALARFAEATALAERALPDWHAKTAFARGRLGDLLAQLGRYQEAVPLLVASWRAQNRLAGSGNAISVQLRERIASVYEAWGRPAEAARWRSGDPVDE